MKPMKHDDAPHPPDRGLAKRYNIDMPHGVPTTSAKGSAQVRTARETRALNMKPLGVVGDVVVVLDVVVGRFLGGVRRCDFF
jgi:hypothetical protein